MRAFRLTITPEFVTVTGSRTNPPSVVETSTYVLPAATLVTMNVFEPLPWRTVTIVASSLEAA